MKKLISLLLLTTALLGCALAQAAPANFENGYYFDIENGGATITSYIGSDENLVVPSMLGGYPVKKLGYNAFEGYDHLRSVTLPTTMEHIGWYALANCYNLREVRIPYGVSYIARGAFSGCESLTSLNLPDSVETIDGYAFSNCVNLQSLVIPESVWRIPSFTFEQCWSLKSLIINGKDTEVSPYAFNVEGWMSSPGNPCGVSSDCIVTCWEGSTADTVAARMGLARKYFTTSKDGGNDGDFTGLPPVEIVPVAEDQLVRIKATRVVANSISYDIDLVNLYGEEIKANGKVTFTIPYLNMSLGQAMQYDVTITHHAASGKEVFTTKDGTINLTKDGFEITVTSFSPFTVSWTSAATDSLPSTGDSSLPMAMLLVMLLSCAMISRRLIRRRA